MMQTSESAARLVDHKELESYVAELFVCAGVPPMQAAGIAEIVVLADLRGMDSHGTRFVPRYLRGLAKGLVNARPRLAFVGGRGATAVLDADNGLGLVSARFGMQRAIELATQHGVGVVAVRNSNHFGTACFYAMQALEARMIGHATTDGPPHTVVWGGREPLVCNDPIAWAFPTASPPAIVIDTALTGVKEKIRLAAERGERIPADWAVDADGLPTTDAQAALAGSLLPIGGHKGSALIVANELLAGGLAGALFSFEISPAIVRGSDHHDRWGCGHYLLALDISAFGNVDGFLRRADELAAAMRSAPRAQGTERIYTPGEREWLTSEQRRVEGIPMGEPALRALDAVASEIGATSRLLD